MEMYVQFSGSRKGRTYLQTHTSVFLRETNTSTIFTFNLLSFFHFFVTTMQVGV